MIWNKTDVYFTTLKKQRKDNLRKLINKMKNLGGVLPNKNTLQNIALPFTFLEVNKFAKILISSNLGK